MFGHNNNIVKEINRGKRLKTKRRAKTKTKKKKYESMKIQQ